MATNSSCSQAPPSFLHFQNEAGGFEVLRSQKGRYQVHYEGYYYNYDKATKGRLAWQCNKRGCKGRIATDEDWRLQSNW
jgi:hypothetical protein